jgi:hypothetical protein
LERRLDVVDDIGAVIAAVSDGESVVGRVAKRCDVPYTTARDWLRRFSARAPILAAGFGALAVAVGAEAGVGVLAADPVGRAVRALRLVAAAVGGVVGVVVGAGVARHRREAAGECHGPAVDRSRRASFHASRSLRTRMRRQRGGPRHG